MIAAGHRPSGPYRGYKGDIWEGGHRVPLVVRWPGRISADTHHDQLVCLTDVFATVAEIVGADLSRAGAEDSFSFLPAALGRKPGADRRTTLVNHSNFGEFAYRSGPWKLLLRNAAPRFESRGQPRIAELYDLATDLGEQRNVAAEHPEIVARLEKELAEVIARGASRSERRGTNDTLVHFGRTQTERWASPAHRGSD